ncbi:MAG: cation:proton antiporter, partial [Armatimonadota bacterium]
MENVWLTSSLWFALALIASLVSIRVGISVALVEIIVGAFAGNLLDLSPNAWVTYLAGAGSIVLTFLAGAEIDPEIVKKHRASSVTIGLVGFLAPFVGVLALARFGFGWGWPQAEIAGLALSTTSVAVVYAVMVETGFNRTELGKIILAACFVNDLGTVLGLGVLFANYNGWLALFAVATALSMWVLPRFVPAFFRAVGSRVSEPESKFILLVLFLLGGMANLAKSEAVLPAYLIGMVLAPFFLRERVLAQRLRVMAFTLLTPFFFLKAGALVSFKALVVSFGLIAVSLAAKMITKFAGILPLTAAFRFGKTKGMYTTLL